MVTINIVYCLVVAFPTLQWRITTIWLFVLTGDILKFYVPASSHTFLGNCGNKHMKFLWHTYTIIIDTIITVSRWTHIKYGLNPILANKHLYVCMYASTHIHSLMLSFYHTIFKQFYDLCWSIVWDAILWLSFHILLLLVFRFFFVFFCFYSVCHCLEPLVHFKIDMRMAFSTATIH